MGILDFLRGVFGGAVREGAEARKQERLNFQAVNKGWSDYARAIERRHEDLRKDYTHVVRRVENLRSAVTELTDQRDECRSDLASAGRSIGDAHGKIAELTSRVAELERK